MFAAEGVETLREHLEGALGVSTELGDLEDQGVEVYINPQQFRRSLWDLLQEIKDCVGH